MTMPAGGGGWIPKSPRGKKILATCVFVAAPIVLAFIIFTGFVGGLR
ncbi:hypothetical protein [Curtobacterium sp. MCSS17_011]|nr:hypothetical protein [Curtobacterium sp. MCSS17_011]